MANPIRINAATLNRPGVFVTQTSTGSLPQPIATHAVGYLFGTTPTEDYYGEDAINAYSLLEPYKPTQVGSVADYLEKVGGDIPSANTGALASYDAVNSFFENVGVNGILYFTRVSPTPETVIDLGASTAGAGYNTFALKINGRYFGTPIGIPDLDGDQVRVITTTALDAVDNARDIYDFLSGNGDGFADFYRIEQTADEALAAKFRIFSRDTRNLPTVERFVAYQLSDSSYATPLDLKNASVVKFYASVKEMNFKCVSRDQDTKEPIQFISGSSISSFLTAAANATVPVTFDPATEQSEIITAFIKDQKLYPVNGSGNLVIPDGKIFAISKDLTTGNTGDEKWRDADAAYWAWSTGAPGSFATVKNGSNALVVPSGTVSASGGVTTRAGYLPDSVQVFYVNVAGEDRAIIVNGATPDDLGKQLATQVRAILAEKELDAYYTVEYVDSGTNLPNTDTHVPNNGHKISVLNSEAGAPYLRPELDDITLSGLVAISGGVVTGTGTAFDTELAPGDTIVARGQRFVVLTVTDADTMTVTPDTVTIASEATISLDKSVPNGFRSFDYVLRVKITSKNGVSSPINAGRNRFGIADPNVVKLVSTDQNSDYEGYKLTQVAKANDFIYAIEQGMGSKALSPGFLLAPEAYTILTYSPGGDLESKSDARVERAKVTQALVRAAEGKLGVTEGIVGTQHIALIDCGADELSLTEVQDELDFIKSTVGVPFGHAAYYAPYIKNSSDRYVAPSSFVAGIACSRYVNEGFQQPPAGARYPLRGAVGLKFDISAQQQEVTYALGLNPIRSLPNRGIVAWGARTLSPNPLFKFVNTRAILNVLVDVLGRSFDDILFEQIDSAGTVYARIKSIASQVLGQFYRQGALFGARPEQAYLVVCSSANNSNADLENGTARLDVYVATSPTLERLLVTIVRTPAGQVSQLSDSFSRNEDRFSYLLDASTVF